MLLLDKLWILGASSATHCNHSHSREELLFISPRPSAVRWFPVRPQRVLYALRTSSAKLRHHHEQDAAYRCVRTGAAAIAEKLAEALIHRGRLYIPVALVVNRPMPRPGQRVVPFSSAAHGLWQGLFCRGEQKPRQPDRRLSASVGGARNHHQFDRRVWRLSPKYGLCSGNEEWCGTRGMFSSDAACL